LTRAPRSDLAEITRTAYRLRGTHLQWGNDLRCRAFYDVSKVRCKLLAAIGLAEDREFLWQPVFVGKHCGSVARRQQNLELGFQAPGLQDAGMEVWAGMILGFDNDGREIFAAHRRFLHEARISTAMVGMLSAIPKTPLYTRLDAAGRLDKADNPAAGTNVVPLNMSRETLSNGYIRLMAELYDPEAYFARLDDLYIAGKLNAERGWRRYAEDHPWQRRVRQLQRFSQAMGLMLRLLWRVPEKQLRKAYRSRFARVLCRRPDPRFVRSATTARCSPDQYVLTCEGASVVLLRLRAML